MALFAGPIDSVEDFMAACAPHAAVLQADISSCTDIDPVVQFSES
jgi:hypothetical protein